MRIAAAACLLLLVTMPLPGKTKPTSLPFTTNSDGMVILPATVGGTVPVHVILDTGAGLDVLAPSLIEKVHGTPAGQFTGFRMTGERLNIPLFVVPELSIGPVVKKNAMVGSWDVLDKLHLDGIVSLNDFRGQPFTIDFPGKMVVFETRESLAARRASAATVPVEFDDQRGVSFDMFAQFLIDGQPGQCEIDTGSQTPVVNTRYMARLGIESDGKDVKKIERRTVAGASETRYNTRLPQISLAAAPQISVTRPAMSFSDIIYDCVIGVDFWAGRTLTVDVPGHQIMVSNSSRTN